MFGNMKFISNDNNIVFGNMKLIIKAGTYEQQMKKSDTGI